MLCSFTLTYLYLNDHFLNTGFPQKLPAPKSPEASSSPLDPDLALRIMKAREEPLPEPSPLPQFGIQDIDNRAQIESFCTYGSGSVATNIYYDYESNATVISCGSRMSEYPQ
jgi:hypothetical protein